MVISTKSYYDARIHEYKNDQRWDQFCLHLYIVVGGCTVATIDPNTDNFMTFAILYFYSFILVIDTTVQNNDNEISLHFKPLRLIFVNYSV